MRIKVIATLIAYCLFVVVVCQPLTIQAQQSNNQQRPRATQPAAQPEPQEQAGPQDQDVIDQADASDEYDEQIPDPRGLYRYTLTGEEVDGSTVFTLPYYNFKPDFFDGFRIVTLEELTQVIGVKEESIVYVQFGKKARKGHIMKGARFYWPNGLRSRRGYVIGCQIRIKKGRHKGKRIKYFNEVYFPPEKEIYVKPLPPKPDEPECSNYKMKLKDVPADWTKTLNEDGKTYRCEPPQPKPPEPVQVPCKPEGGSRQILAEHSKKGFDPKEVARKKLDSSYNVEEVVNLMNVPDKVKKITDLFIYFDGCNYYVYAYSVVNGGLGWWKWLIPALMVASFVAGYIVGRNHCHDCINPTPVAKNEIIPPNRGGSGTSVPRL